MTDIPRLAARIESGEGEQRALLEEAYEAVFGNPPILEYRQPNGQRGTRFIFMLNAEAYLSAAEMLADPLIAEGWFFDLSKRPAHMRQSVAYTHPKKIERGIWYRVEATSIALALASASLKAKEMGK